MTLSTQTGAGRLITFVIAMLLCGFLGTMIGFATIVGAPQ